MRYQQRWSRFVCPNGALAEPSVQRCEACGPSGRLASFPFRPEIYGSTYPGKTVTRSLRRANSKAAAPLQQHQLVCRLAQARSKQGLQKSVPIGREPL